MKFVTQRVTCVLVRQFIMGSQFSGLCIFANSLQGTTIIDGSV